jgi:hypothetical protein
MYNLEEVVKFIENEYNLKLFDYQKQMLDCMIKGYTFSCPIRSGRNMVLNGFIKYLKEKHGKHIEYISAQKHFALENVIKENDKYYDNLVNNEPKFETEYICEWIEEK